MLDQLAIVRKHALAIWNKAGGDPDKVEGVSLHEARLIRQEIRMAFPLIPVILLAIQIVQAIAWLISVLWPKRPPQEDGEDELEQMLAQLSA